MLKLFSVFDSKVGAYLPPMTMRSAGEAVRAFGHACNNVESEFNKFAEDYILFELGTWDELTGTIIMHKTPFSLGKAIEVSFMHKEHYFATSSVKEVVNS